MSNFHFVKERDIMANLNLKNPIVFFDLETTGLSIGKDKIIEIALVKINPNSTREEFHAYINPGFPIPAESTAIHGITDEMVADKPSFKEIAHHIRDFIGTSDLGGYNSNNFDIPFLADEFLQVGIDAQFKRRKFVDVQQIFFKKEERTLSAAYRFYCDKELVDAHSAMADTQATIEILESQLDKYEDLENDIQFLHDFSSNGEIVDYARRMIKKDGKILFNFGKYRGQSVEQVLKREPQYYDWMMQADFPRDTKNCLAEIFNAIHFK